MPDIFDEVEEDLRAERARSFGLRFGGLVAAGLVLVLIGTGAYVWWGQQTTAQAQAIAGSFIAASKQAERSILPLGGTDKADASQAAESFAGIASKGPAGYAVLARLHLAALQWRLAEKPQAIATWLAVSNDAGAPKLLRDLATITSAEHQVDSADPVLLKQNVETLTALDNPWRPMAQQVIALIDLRMGKTNEARLLMTHLSADPMAPEGIRQMVSDLLATLPPAPAQTAPAQTSPLQTAPLQTAPVQTPPVQTGPLQTGPLQTGPVPPSRVPATPASVKPATHG